MSSSLDSTILIGDCVEEMAKMPADSVNAIVTDPPYGLKFMGKRWDDPGAFVERRSDRSVKFDKVGGNHNPCNPQDQARTARVENQRQQEWHETWAREALRVLKPGGFAVVAGGTRTFHRLVCALEDAGFEIRDTIAHIYGSGFPKSKSMKDIGHPELGTALKPAFEPWTLARKPLSEKNVAQNVLKHGTGAINVDGCRVAGTTKHNNANGVFAHSGSGKEQAQHVMKNYTPTYESTQGRWPPNLLLSHYPDCKPTGEVRRVKPPQKAAGTPGFGSGREDGYTKGAGREYPDGTEPQEVWECVEGCPIRLLDEQSGQVHAGGHKRRSNASTEFGYHGGTNGYAEPGINTYSDQGGASRFFPRFGGENDIRNGVSLSARDGGGNSDNASNSQAGFKYIAKASRRERNAGLEGMPEHEQTDYRQYAKGRTFTEGEWVETGGRTRPRQNNHPTVKPIALMRWLVRLVTPPGEASLVLDPFMGSGSTGCAAVLEGFNFIGIEQDPEYAEIARRRIAYWLGRGSIAPTEAAEAPDPTDPTFTGRLF